MSQHLRSFAAAVIFMSSAVILVGGCEASDESTPRHRQQEADAQQLAAQHAARQRDEQQPRSNPDYKRVVRPQPTEDPAHTGRPVNE
jgi:hypothetical protein